MSTSKKKISMESIANCLGVSKYTVSQALSGKPGVSESTRQEVAAMARVLGYRIKTDQPAAAIKPGSADLTLEASSRLQLQHAPSEKWPQIAVWMHPDLQNEKTFWSRVRNGIITGCREQSFQERLLLLPAASYIKKGDAAAALKSSESYLDLLPDNCAGIIVLGTLPIPLLLKLQKPGIPLVLVDHEEPLMDADCVLNANLQAAQAACRHLLSGGCKSLLFLGKDSFSVSFKERWWGCRQALDEHSRTHAGCTLKKWTLPYGQPGWEQQLAKRILSLEREQLPDGFVCANDQIALALLSILQQSSINVPVDCKVTGIDNIEESASSTPPLTTVELAKELLGYRAVEALVRKMNRPGFHAEKIILSARLITRGSS